MQLMLNVILKKWLTVWHISFTIASSAADTCGAEEVLPEKRTRYRGLQIENTQSRRSSDDNRTRVFLAAMYIRDCLLLMVQGNKELHKVNITRHNHDFKALCYQLNRNEPDLKGVTISALVALYNNILENWHKLDDFTKTATSEIFTETKFSKLAEDLGTLDQEIHQAKTDSQTVKDAKAIEDSNKQARIKDKAFNGRRSELNRAAPYEQQQNPKWRITPQQPSDPAEANTSTIPVPVTLVSPASTPSFMLPSPIAIESSAFTQHLLTATSSSTSTPPVPRPLLTDSNDLVLQHNPQEYTDPLALAQDNTPQHRTPSRFIIPVSTQQSSVSGTESEKPNSTSRRAGLLNTKRKYCMEARPPPPPPPPTANIISKFEASLKEMHSRLQASEKIQEQQQQELQKMKATAKNFEETTFSQFVSLTKSLNDSNSRLQTLEMWNEFIRKKIDST